MEFTRESAMLFAIGKLLFVDWGMRVPWVGKSRHVGVYVREFDSGASVPGNRSLVKYEVGKEGRDSSRVGFAKVVRSPLSGGFNCLAFPRRLTLWQDADWQGTLSLEDVDHHLTAFVIAGGEVDAQIILLSRPLWQSAAAKLDQSLFVGTYHFYDSAKIL